VAVVTLRCGVCAGVTGDYQALHRHIFNDHQELVVIERDGPRMYYRVVCPICSQSYRQAIKGGMADEEFVSEFESDIRLVGSDILLQHLIGEHSVEMGVDSEVSDDGS
jgi:hypothetical protein